MLDLLCDLARNGPDRVQTHAAWVVSSLSVTESARAHSYFSSKQVITENLSILAVNALAVNVLAVNSVS